MPPAISQAWRRLAIGAAALATCLMSAEAGAEQMRTFGAPPRLAAAPDTAVAWTMAADGAHPDVAALVDKNTAFCAATYIGSGAVLTSRACARRVRTQVEPTRVVFPHASGGAADAVDVAFYQHATPAAIGCSAQTPDCGQDLAVVRFHEMRVADGLSPIVRLMVGLLDHAAVSTDRATPVPLAGVDVLLGNAANSFDLVGYGVTIAQDRAVSLRSTAGRQAVRRLRARPAMCGVSPVGGAGCGSGRELVALDQGLGCPAETGSPLFAELGKRHHLAGVVSRSAPGTGSACSQTMIVSLVTPRVIRWLVTELGIPVVTCGHDGRCEIVASGQ